MAIEFGKCPCGGGPYREQAVKVRSTTPGRSFEMTDVPQGACDTCGSRVYKLDTLWRIEAVMQGDRRDPAVRAAD
ncbi:MAG TPA: hypothetical protein VM846_09130 [Vicinamibacterales bacterium]|jgi:hypothetical protein|nr:hypothetical protein [Vicinamibacterales bacterium]